MLDRLVEKVLGFLPGADLLASDTLTGAFNDAIAARLAPIAASVLADVRNQILESARPEPPEAFAAELRAIAPRLTDEMIEMFWNAAFRALCAGRAPQPKPKTRLLLVGSPEEEAG